MAAKITPPDADYLARLYYSGHSSKELAELFGVSQSLVGNWFQMYGIKKDPRPAPDASELRRRYDAGETVQDIADTMGVSRPWLYRWFIAYGIPCESGVKRVAAKEKRAKTVEARGLHISPFEREFAAMLTGLGLDVIPQKAVGPYNVDIATGSVAVEIYGGGWHAARSDRERFAYLLDRGWSVVIIWVDPAKDPLTTNAAEYVVSFRKEAEGNPSVGCGYRVIRGSGHLLSSGGPNSDDLPDIFTRRHQLDIPVSVPYGTCHCGCGEQTWVSPLTNRKRGWVKGEPVKWLTGHHLRGSKWVTGEDGRRQHAS